MKDQARDLLVDCLKQPVLELPSMSFGSFVGLLEAASANRILYLFATKVRTVDSDKQELIDAVLEDGEARLDALGDTLRFCERVLSGCGIEFLVVRTDKYVPYVTFDVDLFVEERCFKGAGEAFRGSGCEVLSHDGSLGGRLPGCQLNIRKERLLQIDMHRDFTWMRTRHVDTKVLGDGAVRKQVAGVECSVPAPEMEFLLNLSSTVYEKFHLPLLDFLTLRQSLLQVDDTGVVTGQVESFGWKKAFRYSMGVSAAMNELVFEGEENPFLQLSGLSRAAAAGAARKIRLPHMFPVPRALGVFGEKLVEKKGVSATALAYFFFTRIRYYATMKRRLPYYDHWFDFSRWS